MLSSGRACIVLVIISIAGEADTLHRRITMPLSTLNALFASHKVGKQTVSESGGRQVGCLVASVQPMLIHGSSDGESMC